ncbi:hypothetical protein PISMIDRAFT_437750 [Pisolithus microcarpus 441]|uniref:Uncharacterized protein n=1 Tax=Pisolithus microcarpus 441 TaxID=765257 RepID=A0A0C9YPY6_9AGAM|nr:hypothetical protein PISMIDRAFT_437750 [Pisolithus microcarpus 441]
MANVIDTETVHIYLDWSHFYMSKSRFDHHRYLRFSCGRASGTTGPTEMNVRALRYQEHEHSSNSDSGIKCQVGSVTTSALEVVFLST